MSCELTQGYTIDCRDNVGGIKTVYVTELVNVESVTEASGVATAISMAGGKIFFTYEMVKETATASEKPTTNDANGTVFYDQSVDMQIRKQQASMRNEVVNLAKNRLAFIILDRNGKYWLYGKNNGLEMQTSENAFGTAMGDFNGYKLKFMGKEESAAIEVSSGVIADIIE